MKIKEWFESLKNKGNFDMDCKLHIKIPDEELKGMRYPYPYDNVSVELDLDDISYSENIVAIGCHVESDNRKPAKPTLEQPIENGVLRAECSLDPMYPGIDIEFISENEDETAVSNPRVLIEKPKDGKLRVLIWSNPNSEDYTTEITLDVN